MPQILSTDSTSTRAGSSEHASLIPSIKRSSPYGRTEPENHGVTAAALDEARFEEKSRESPYINPESWLRVLFEADEATVVEEQIDTIAKKLDDWLYSESFERVDEVFELLNEEFFEQSMRQLDVPLTLLMVVHGAEGTGRLPRRKEFVDRVWDQLVARESEERARAYLGNLR